MTVIYHMGYVRRSRRGRALKLDISLEAFLLADRYTARDGNEWVGMTVSIGKLLDVLEGRIEVAGVNQIKNPARPGTGKGVEHGAEA
jgi:hypothetical protein